MSDQKFLVSFSPHLRDDVTTSRIMLDVVIALVPAMAVSVWFYGMMAVSVYAYCIVFSLGLEALFLKMAGRPLDLSDNSALVTAILLAMNMPPAAAWWLCLVGSFVAIVVTKQVFGGLGQNVFNPALVGRIFLLISWPAQMTSWLAPGSIAQNGFMMDAVTAATPLGAAKTELLTYGSLQGDVSVTVASAFFGTIGGSLGEMSALAILLGGAYLIARRIISWHIPVIYIGTVFALTTATWLIAPERTLDPVTHMFAGGLMLGAFFMATDYVSNPVTLKGHIVFALGCGVLTYVIRQFGGYPEGVAFSILIMNAFVPLIDYYIRPVSFGEVV